MAITKYNQREQSKHHHEFELRDKYKQFTCEGCKLPGFGSRYRCEQCDYVLHKECYDLRKERISPKSTIVLGAFECSEFQFFPNAQTNGGNGPFKVPARTCYACGKDIDGFFIHCNNGKIGNDLLPFCDLHPCCAHLKNELCIDGRMCELRQKVSKCKWCKKKKLSGTDSKIQGLSYVSKCKKYNYHVYCVTEMEKEAWKKGASESKSIRVVDTTVTRHSNRDSGGRGNGVWKTVKMSLTAIVSILVGDPTMIVSSGLVEWISK